MRRLTESGVNIKTTYIVDGTLRYRSTDGTCQDDVHSGIRCRKEYFRQGKLLHTEKIFDSRMEYTYVSGMDEEAQHTCENCGFTGKVKEFVNGCPCCDAASNIDYADKELGSKHHYDLVLQSPVYRIVTGVVDYIISFLLYSLWIINTSRTFNGYDVGKIFIYSTTAILNCTSNCDYKLASELFCLGKALRAAVCLLENNLKQPGAVS